MAPQSGTSVRFPAGLSSTDQERPKNQTNIYFDLKDNVADCSREVSHLFTSGLAFMRMDANAMFAGRTSMTVLIRDLSKDQQLEGYLWNHV